MFSLLHATILEDDEADYANVDAFPASGLMATHSSTFVDVHTNIDSDEETSVDCLCGATNNYNNFNNVRPGCIELIGGKLYTFLQPIGQGSDGEVFLATERSSGQPLAVKIISKEGKGVEQVRRARREAELHKSLQLHPNVLTLHDVAETQDELCLVTDYAANGDLFELLYGADKDAYRDLNGLVEERLAKKIFVQTLLAVEHCHRHHIAHRDIKPENILLDHNMDVKLADFGLAFRFRRNGVVSTPVGSLVYAAPEVLNGTGYEGPEIDTWALGVLLFELVAGTYPFILDNTESDTNSLETQKEMCQRILSCKYDVPDYVDPDAIALIKKILQPRKRRITIPEIKQSPWIRAIVAELEPNTADSWLLADEDNFTLRAGKENKSKVTKQRHLSWNTQSASSLTQDNTAKVMKQKFKKARRNAGSESRKPLIGVHQQQSNRTNLLTPVPLMKPNKMLELCGSRSLTPDSTARNCRTEANVFNRTTIEQPTNLGFSWPKWSLPDRPRTLSADCS